LPIELRENRVAMLTEQTVYIMKKRSCGEDLNAPGRRQKRRKSLISQGLSWVGGRNRARTCDPIDVNDVLYQHRTKCRNADVLKTAKIQVYTGIIDRQGADQKRLLFGFRHSVHTDKMNPSLSSFPDRIICELFSDFNAFDHCFLF
ncbi:MAG: hypothetical protein IKD50_09210, partial [Clostridia bacterium]|nr:hypothetical protein [Clostridia bacterium]